MFRSYEKCNTDFLENGPKPSTVSTLYIYTIFIPQKFRRQQNSWNWLGNQKVYLRVFFLNFSILLCLTFFRFYYSEYEEERPTKNCACRQRVVFPDSCRCFESWRPFNKISAPGGILFLSTRMSRMLCPYFSFCILSAIEKSVKQDKSSSIAHRLLQWWNDSGSAPRRIVFA